MGLARGGFNNDFASVCGEPILSRLFMVTDRSSLAAARPNGGRGEGPEVPSLSASGGAREVASSEPEAVPRRPSKARAIALY